MLQEQFLKTVEPKPPASLTRKGAFLCIALAIVSLVGAIYLSITATDKNAVVPIAAFSIVACGYVLWSCMKVLQGYNTGGNRINCVLAMITNSLIGSILVLFADFGQPQHLGPGQLQAQGLLRPQLHQHLASAIAQAQATTCRGPQRENRGFPQQHPHLGTPKGPRIGPGGRRLQGRPGPGQAQQQAP
jgi:hypothetical protein